MEYKERGWNAKNANQCSGVIKASASSTTPLMTIQGKFTQGLTLTDLRKEEQEQKIWTPAPLPEKHDW